MIEIFGIPYLKEGNIVKYLEGTTEEGLTKEDSVRLLKLKPKFVGNRSDEYFWRNFTFKKDTSDVADFFKSYLSSKGFERILNNQDNWWKSRHPYRKWYSNSDLGTRDWFELAKRINPNLYTADMYANLSASYVFPDEPQRTNIVGIYEASAIGDGYAFNPIEARGHEYAHGIAPFNIFGAALFSSESAQAEALDLNTNTRPGHDSRREEKHADLWGLRYLLYKEGIYDSRGDKDITEEEILKLREKYPDLRPLKLMDNKLLMFQLNNVAFSDSDVIRAKSGIKIKKKNRGKFTEYCGGKVTDECILRAKKSKNPTLRKRATFALNARGWAKKHLGGGETYTKEQEAVQRALSGNKPASNYSEAIDMSVSKLREVATDWVLKLGNFFGVPAITGLSNCTLTASQWANPDRPIGRAVSIVTDPEKHKFTQIPEEYIIPGTLVIASKDPALYKDGVDNVYHTMLLTGFADKNYDFSYGGKKYKIKKGEPLVDYSKGLNMASELRRNIPLSVYNDQGEGKTFNRFYKPQDDKIAQAFLPEITVKPK